MTKPKLTKKQQATQKKMKDNRKNDFIYLRSILEDKLAWARNEHYKGKQGLEKLKDNLQDTEEKVIKLEGIISFCEQILSEAPKKED